MKKFFKKYYRDIIIIVGIIVCSLATIFIVKCSTNKEAVSATISQQNAVVLTIDLSKESEEVREIPFPNQEVKIVIGVKKNAICVLRSECPHQDCVKTGWVSEAGKPIVCAHYKVTITISGTPINDVEVK